MKTFEEKWTAWLDDQLTGQELLEFEASLPDKTAAEAEKKAARQLGVLLKRELSAPTLTNEEFFSHQLRERMAREEAGPVRAGAGSVSTCWTIRRLLWTGAASMALFLICAVFVMREEERTEPSASLTTILNMRVEDGTASMFESKEARVTVLWTEGLKSLPSEYAAK